VTQVVIGIFVGGEGKRMGRLAKGLLRAPASDETLVGRLLRVCTDAIAGATVCLVGRATPYAELGLPQIADDPSGVGPIGGLRALLLHARALKAERALALACDLPFIDRTVLEALNLPLNQAARVPFVAGRFQPLAAAYAPIATLAAIDRMLARGKHALMQVLAELGASVERIEGDAIFGESLRDWDTPEDITR
jgi:molybdopterin-guanine dinucleotide biosynthesis protein A